MFILPVVEITGLVIVGFILAGLASNDFARQMITIGTSCMVIYAIKRATDPDDKDPDGDA